MPALRRNCAAERGNYARPDRRMRYDANPSTSRRPVTHAREPHRPRQRSTRSHRWMGATAAWPRRCASCCRKPHWSASASASRRCGCCTCAAALPQLPGARLADAVRARAQQLADAPDAGAAAAVKSIEARINHDVKAVEYYVREQLAAAGAPPATLELVHFGCTSEDINNLAYARLLQAARRALLPVLAARIRELSTLARRYAALAMLARTHGQPASPTTLGKELANFAARLQRLERRWGTVEHSRQVERRGRQFQRPRSGRARGRLAGRGARVRHLAGTGIQPLDHADRAARLDRRVLRCAGGGERGVHRPVPRPVGLHLARLSAPARGRRRGRLVHHAAQGEPDRLRECRRQLRGRQRAAATLRRQTAAIALAA